MKAVDFWLLSFFLDRLQRLLSRWPLLGGLLSVVRPIDVWGGITCCIRLWGREGNSVTVSFLSTFWVSPSSFFPLFNPPSSVRPTLLSSLTFSKVAKDSSLQQGGHCWRWHRQTDCQRQKWRERNPHVRAENVGTSRKTAAHQNEDIKSSITVKRQVSSVENIWQERSKLWRLTKMKRRPVKKLFPFIPSSLIT